MSFQPNRGSESTLISLSGASLLSVSGIYLTSGSIRGQCSLVSASTNLITFYPPATPPGNLRSGLFTIYNLFGSATETNYFTQIQTPKISGINPSSGFTGNYFRISGSGARDYTGLWFNDLYTGVLTDPIFENSTWIRSGIIPFFSGGLNAYFSVKVMSEGGSSVSPTLYFVRENGLSLSGLVGFPSPIQTYNFLRGNSTADGLEWQTPNQVLVAITGVNKSGGDYLTGNYFITGGMVNLTGLNIQNSGITTGNMIFDTISSGAFLVLRARIGGITWIGSTLQYS